MTHSDTDVKGSKTSGTEDSSKTGKRKSLSAECIGLKSAKHAETAVS